MARPLLSTHIALPLSILGTLGWLSLNVVFAPETVRSLMESGFSSDGSIGLMFLVSDGAFLLWAYWRFRLFRVRHEQAPSEQPR